MNIQAEIKNSNTQNSIFKKQNSFKFTLKKGSSGIIIENSLNNDVQWTYGNTTYRLTDCAREQIEEIKSLGRRVDEKVEISFLDGDLNINRGQRVKQKHGLFGKIKALGNVVSMPGGAARIAHTLVSKATAEFGGTYDFPSPLALQARYPNLSISSKDPDKMITILPRQDVGPELKGVDLTTMDNIPCIAFATPQIFCHWPSYGEFYERLKDAQNNGTIIYKQVAEPGVFKEGKINGGNISYQKITIADKALKDFENSPLVPKIIGRGNGASKIKTNKDGKFVFISLGEDHKNRKSFENLLKNAAEDSFNLQQFLEKQHAPRRRLSSFVSIFSNSSGKSSTRKGSSILGGRKSSAMPDKLSGEQRLPLVIAQRDDLESFHNPFVDTEEIPSKQTKILISSSGEELHKFLLEHYEGEITIDQDNQLYSNAYEVAGSSMENVENITLRYVKNSNTYELCATARPSGQKKPVPIRQTIDPLQYPFLYEQCAEQFTFDVCYDPESETIFFGAIGDSIMNALDTTNIRDERILGKLRARLGLTQDTIKEENPQSLALYKTIEMKPRQIALARSSFEIKNLPDPQYTKSSNAATKPAPPYFEPNPQQVQPWQQPGPAVRR